MTTCRRVLYLRTAHMKSEQVEKRLFFFGTQVEGKKKAYPGSRANTALKCCIVYLYCCFLVVLGFLLLVG